MVLTPTLGTRGRQWIPFYGTFGGKINEAWIKGDLFLMLEDAKTGARLLERSFPEEHRDRTSIYTKPNVGYLQGEYLSGIVSEIIATIERAEGGQERS